jgi:hypothetical protein
MPAAMLSVILIFSIGLGSAMALDLSWEGKTYRHVEVVSVEEGEVVLETNMGQITVPKTSLTWQLEARVKAFVKKRSELDGPAQQPEGDGEKVNQDELERVWVHGSATATMGDGFRVYSTWRSLAVKASRSGRVHGPAERTKGGVPIYNGAVWIKGVSSGENSEFDGVVWRDGFHEDDGRMLPAFSSSKPEPLEVPNVADERVWKNGDGKVMTASLKAVKDGKGLFYSPKGKRFVYPVENLTAEDQAFVKAALEQHGKVLEQLRRDHPGQRLE